MTKNKISLQRYAMNAGTAMGLYWIIKFIFFPLGFTNSFLMFIFMVLTLAVPFLGYYFTRKMRDNVMGGTISYMHSCMFMILMYLFASLLASVAHYIYFRFFDNGYIINSYMNSLEALKNIPEFSKMSEQYQLQSVLEVIGSMNATEMTMQLLSQNMFYCTIISFVSSLFVMKRKRIS